MRSVLVVLTIRVPEGGYSWGRGTAWIRVLLFHIGSTIDFLGAGFLLPGSCAVLESSWGPGYLVLCILYPLVLHDIPFVKVVASNFFSHTLVLPYYRGFSFVGKPNQLLRLSPSTRLWLLGILAR